MIHNSKLPPYINDLVNARKEKGITQGKLAELIGCEATYLSKIERGKKPPSMQLLGLMCDELGLHIRLLQPDGAGGPKL